MINPKAYTEVNEIIKNMPKDMQEKIPEELRKMIEYNMDKEYNIHLEKFKKLELLEDTEKILSVLYTDFLATDEERKVILAKEKATAYQKEVEKMKKYPANFMKIIKK